MTCKEYLSQMHLNTDKRLSFNTFIFRLRKMVAIEHCYIMSSVDYDSIFFDLVDFGYIPKEHIAYVLDGVGNEN